ncbi:unnamed protein product [Ilex paraguariensis]
MLAQSQYFFSQHALALHFDEGSLFFALISKQPPSLGFPSTGQSLRHIFRLAISNQIIGSICQ